jgi:hypothetical protein
MLSAMETLVTYTASQASRSISSVPVHRTGRSRSTRIIPANSATYSTFSGAGAVVIAYAFGSNGAFNAKVTIPAGSSKIESGVPAKNVVLYWKTLDDASDEAGWSRRWGGIHYETGDLHGRGLGKTIGYNVWTKALTYFNGTATATT